MKELSLQKIKRLTGNHKLLKRGHIKTAILTPSDDSVITIINLLLRKGQQEKELLAVQIMKLTLTRNKVLEIFENILVQIYTN